MKRRILITISMRRVASIAGGAAMTATKASPASPEHTPGPWERSTGEDGHVIYQHGAGTICTVPIDLQSHEANARLIAAAPTLLAACRAIVAEISHLHEPWDDLNFCPVCKAQAAIDKAEGREAL